MLEPPNLAETALCAALSAHWGLEAAELAFLPLGADSASFVYRVRGAGGGDYLLKVRAGRGFRPPSLTIPRYLAEQGVAHIVAPIPTRAGALWAMLEGFALSLHPFIAGRVAREAGLSLGQWRAFGATVWQIHVAQLPPDLLATLPRETFIPGQRSVMDDLAAAVAEPLDDSVGRELAAIWRAHQGELSSVLARADALGGALREAARPLPWVLCHADLHTWNVLVDPSGEFWLVDWDEVVLAPKERDLMFVVGGIGRGLVSPQETTRFLEGYGEAAADARALAYYRAAWAVQDLAAYGERACLLPDLSAAARRDALHAFVTMLEPGNMIAIALGSEWATLTEEPT